MSRHKREKSLGISLIGNRFFGQKGARPLLTTIREGLIVDFSEGGELSPCGEEDPWHDKTEIQPLAKKSIFSIRSLDPDESLTKV